jgi:hypothetical protein
MKALDLIKKLQELPEGSEVCALWWTQETFDDAYQPITDDQWSKVCDQFDNWDNAGAEVSEWISDAVIDAMIEEME